METLKRYNLKLLVKLKDNIYQLNLEMSTVRRPEDQQPPPEIVINFNIFLNLSAVG